MLQVVNDTIQEMNAMQTTLTTTGTYTTTGGGVMTGSVTGGFLGQATTLNNGVYWPYQTYWNNYPVYVCTDKTKKAIEVLKALQAEKMLTCNSVPRFIELVEKISNIL